MIVLDLCCAAGHRFEGWFASADAFADQSAKGMVTCPACGDAQITRLPVGPHLVRSQRPAPAQPPVSPEAAMQMLRALIDSTENVGRQFPEEARRIHRQEAPVRNIRGTASLQDAKDLLEEGIAVLPLPLPPDDEPLN